MPSFDKNDIEPFYNHFYSFQFIDKMTYRYKNYFKYISSDKVKGIVDYLVIFRDLFYQYSLKYRNFFEDMKLQFESDYGIISDHYELTVTDEIVDKIKDNLSRQ